jgi:hypothetical protein
VAGNACGVDLGYPSVYSCGITLIFDSIIPQTCGWVVLMRCERDPSRTLSPNLERAGRAWYEETECA